MSPKISVIIPFYSNISWLKEAVDSVLSQTYQNFEIIIINDGSKEKDTLFIEAYKSKILYIKTQNRGPGAARNLGINKAQGEYIAFLDSDDIWHPIKLEVQLEFMENKNLIWSHTEYNLFCESDNSIIKKIDASNFYGDVFLNCLVSIPLATPCVMIKSSFLHQNPTIRFSETMRYGQDLYMWIHLAQSQPLGAINKSLTNVRIRGNNAARRARVQIQVKSQLWELIKSERKNNPKFSSIPWVVKLSYKISFLNFQFIQLIENSFKPHISASEIIAKILYMPSYSLLKIYSLKLKHRNSK